MRQSTPWGPAQTAVVLAEGIISYSTASHGGIWLSAKRRKEIAKTSAQSFLGTMEWWEEDCDWSVPFWYFRHDIQAFATGWTAEHLEASLIAAQVTIRGYHPECSQFLLSSPAILQKGE